MAGIIGIIGFFLFFYVCYKVGNLVLGGLLCVADYTLVPILESIDKSLSEQEKKLNEEKARKQQELFEEMCRRWQRY